jgi:hypothetical protein
MRSRRGQHHRRGQRQHERQHDFPVEAGLAFGFGVGLDEPLHAVAVQPGNPGAVLAVVLELELVVDRPAELRRGRELGRGLDLRIVQRSGEEEPVIQGSNPR